MFKTSPGYRQENAQSYEDVRPEVTVQSAQVKGGSGTSREPEQNTKNSNSSTNIHPRWMTDVTWKEEQVSFQRETADTFMTFEWSKNYLIRAHLEKKVILSETTRPQKTNVVCIHLQVAISC